MTTEAAARRQLGWGVRAVRVDEADLGMDIALTTAGGLDLQQVSGLDNLDQCLRMAFTTALGADVFNVDFGFDGVAVVAREPDPVLARERVRISVVQVLSRDRRVRQVLDLRLDPDRSDDAGGASPAERAHRWGRLDVEVAFEAVTGDQRVLGVLRTVDGA
ncbi:hypothetical protein [Modestobacter lapidis]|nr:hypothetical protein [Modestobacter lapidis]